MAISVRGEQKRGKRKSSQVTKVVFKETSFVLNSTPSLSEFLQKSSADSILEFQVDGLDSKNLPLRGLHTDMLHSISTLFVSCNVLSLSLAHLRRKGELSLLVL